MAEGVGRELTPSKFGIETTNPNEVAPVSKPDKFGQVYSAERDQTKGGAPSPGEVNKSHVNSDVDASVRSLHHTLGMRRNQASPGNHIHDGVTSPKIGAWAVGSSADNKVPAFTLTGSKGGNVALTNLITFLKLHFNFTDTTT